MSTEKPGQRTEIFLRHHKKRAAFKEKAIDHQEMQAGMPSGIITGALNSDDNTWYPGFLTEDEFEKFRQTFHRTLAELARQRTVIGKESAQDFGDGENIVTVGNRVKNRFLEVMTKLDHFLIMARWAEPSAPAAEH